MDKLTGARVMLLGIKPNSDSIIESNSSSFSSLSQFTQNQGALQQNLSMVDEIMSFCNETENSNQTNDNSKLCNPSFLITNVTFNKSSNYAFLVTSNGDIFFFKINIADTVNKLVIWHRNINVFIMKYFKVDINVS